MHSLFKKSLIAMALVIAAFSCGTVSVSAATTEATQISTELYAAKQKNNTATGSSIKDDDSKKNTDKKNTDRKPVVKKPVVAKAKITNLRVKDRGIAFVVSKADKGNVTYYEIEKKNSKGRWVKVATRKGSRVSYYDASGAYRTTYRYRARAVYSKSGKLYKGKYSSAVKAYTSLKVANAAISSATPGKLSVKLNFIRGKAGKLSGYYLYKKDSKGVWRNKAIVVSTGNYTFVDTGVRFRGTYYYRLRPYFMDSVGRKYFGSYTGTIKATVTVYAQNVHVTDRNSALYGKYITVYKYGDGTTVQNPENYVKIKADRYEIYVNKAREYVTVYAIAGKQMIPVKAFAISSGVGKNWTPEGTFYTKAKYRWHLMSGGVYCQWLTRITGHILFHSECYNGTNNNTMSVRGYNKLGSVASHGCVRLQAGNAKWLYDHCKVGTKVVIHSKKGYEPMSKPVVGKLPSWHTWDPSDPTAQKYCKEHKCHNYSR